MVRKILTFFPHSILIILLKISLFIHKKTYTLLTVVAEIIEGPNKHPKHRIMKYREWFASNIQHDWNILDIGSNNGHMSFFLADYCHHVYGIEIVDHLVKLARNLHTKDNITYICADATTYNYDNTTIDCITMSNVLEHINDRVSFLKKLIQQVHWRNNPLFLIRVPLIDRDWLPMYLNEFGLDTRLDPTHFTEYTVEQLKNEINQCGLDITSYHVQWGEVYAICK